ncbi:SET domain-containing protein [Amniculicola lignicola CBS 123094]|uniref:SET domain-containing protein n=1 Tax=Amniculicola lignicola CBS 123094 TaxID=1392246 RepID=A0A6A5WV07_9PLEO|nr:SET domain-containing protein [Amniculicola lignicola CBS 123094]
MTTPDRVLTVVANAPYEVRQIPGKGFGCFAVKDLKRGNRILTDDPLLIVPVGEYYLKDVEEAFQKLSPAEQALYFTLHSAHGQDPAKWPAKVHPSVSPMERLRILEQHHARIGKEPSLISIFQTNAMEHARGAAIFPYAARFNHSCNPNACFAWNNAIQKETIHAAADIKAGEEITVSYGDIKYDRDTRRWTLKHYGFECDCPACSGDVTNLNSWAGKSEERRFRMRELDEETHTLRGRNLEAGARTEGFLAKLLEFAKLLIEERDHTIHLANIYVDIALICERQGNLVIAKATAEKALRVKLDCHGPDFPDLKNYTGVVRRIKKKIEAEKKAPGKSMQRETTEANGIV